MAVAEKGGGAGREGEAGAQRPGLCARLIQEVGQPDRQAAGWVDGQGRGWKGNTDLLEDVDQAVADATTKGSKYWQTGQQGHWNVSLVPQTWSFKGMQHYGLPMCGLN